jgi:plastocyanin
MAAVVIVLLYLGFSFMQGHRAPGVREIDLKVENKKLNLNPPIIDVVQGDQVTLRIWSDESGEFHIHGYDVMAQLESGTTATLRFTADKAGTFDIELHTSQGEVPLGSLQVTPP